ncbi:UDP-sugar pyrophosphorylase [Trypanosoma grayi]|uniref:UDP-sugar pyrophosphorylase n=1 Tax=Trypanosoma grayi TaxID=71804 RepID=UPI0004F4700E|nr:UDP-sugar pyrophosphorylase [Trypanosoma grayi]KEG14115.1 UDP-sugar pyrophosphorylase [Trypanosoma grayi]
MTSAQNDTQTQKYFAENKFFGLSPDQVHFFKQLSLPCYEEETGKILMESSGRMCLAPGGNGGVYTALTTPPHGEKESVLQRMERMGIKYVQIGNVDNMLAKVADPIFIGFAVKEHVDVVVKSSPKTCPEESVGVFVRADGEWGVVEYTEVGERAKEVNSATGELRFNCANISCNVCSVPFLRVAAEHMKSFTRYHIARKKIPTINGPTMGVKLEAFIFDLFQFAKECGSDSAQGGGFRIMQVDRSEDFAPIKNAEGATSDTPTEAARLTLALHKRWLTAALQAIAAAGGADAKDATAALAVLQRDSVSVEVSPLVSSGGEGLAPYLPRVIQQLLCGEGEKILVDREDEHVMDRSNI